MKRFLIILFGLLFMTTPALAYDVYMIQMGGPNWSAMGVDLIPKTDDAYDIGSNTFKWRDIYIDGVGYIDQLAVNTDSPAGALHAVLSPGHPAIFGGDTIATLTGVTVSNANPSVLTKDATIDDGLAVGDAVILNSGTNGTVGTYWVASIVANTSVTLDRQAATGACTDAVITYVNDPIVIETSSGSGVPRIVVPSGNNSGYAFGDGDTKIYEISDDSLAIEIGGQPRYSIASNNFRSFTSYAFELQRSAGSATSPIFTFRDDNDTGMGRGGPDQPSLIAGGVEGQRIIEANSVIYNLFGVTQQDSITDGETDGTTTISSDGITGDDFLSTCQEGDAVLVWGGTTTAAYGLYYIVTVTDNNNLVLNKAVSGTNSDVDFYVLRGGLIQSSDGITIMEGVLRIAETTTPTAADGIGALYTKTDDKLYFQDGNGAEHEISTTEHFYAEMYLNNNSDDTVFNTSGYPVTLHSFTTGQLNGFTFDAGRLVEDDIDQETDQGGQLGITTVGDHNLETGDVISLNGMLNAAHNGITEITDTGDKTFTCDDIAYVANAGASAGRIVEGSHLIAGTGSAGKYVIAWHLSTSPAGSDTYKVQMYIDAAVHASCISQRKFPNNDQGSMAGGAIMTIADGDKIYIAITNTSGTNDLTNQYGNFNMHRL